MNSSVYEDNDVENTWYQNLGSQIEKNDSKENITSNDNDISMSTLGLDSSATLQKNNFMKDNSVEIVPDYLKQYYYPRSPSPMIMFGEINDNYHVKSPNTHDNGDVVDHNTISDNGGIPLMTYDHYTGMYSTGLISNVTSDGYRYSTDDMEGIEEKEEIQPITQQESAQWLQHDNDINEVKNAESEYMEQKVYAELTNVNNNLHKSDDIPSINSPGVIVHNMGDNNQSMDLEHYRNPNYNYKSNVLMRHFHDFVAKTKYVYNYDAGTINNGLTEMNNFLSHHKAITLMKGHEMLKSNMVRAQQNGSNTMNNHTQSSPEEFQGEDCNSTNFAREVNHDNVHLMDLENFASHFKNSRIKYGFTQGDVGQQLGYIFGGEVSQTTISRFEALNLSYKNMIKQKPYLEEWLKITQKLMMDGKTVDEIMKNKLHGQFANYIKAQHELEKESTSMYEGESNYEDDQKLRPHVTSNIPLNPILKKRRKRTNLDITQREYLNRCFNMEPNPDHQRMEEIALDLGLDKEIVRVWFCNKRQKMRKFSLVSGVIIASRLY
uniref:POU domain protein n=1 Tax=Parastrongyloides trichosuri TaxID=131310 RepID=A0A0N4ZNS3_PARTI